MAGIGDLLGMMKDFGSMKERMAQIQGELERQTVEGSAGGGMVTVTINGRQELISLKIDPAAVDPKDVALLEEMVKGAVGQAMAKAKDLQREGVTKLLGGMPLPPGLLDAML
jgi:hypothetical protein